MMIVVNALTAKTRKSCKLPCLCPYNINNVRSFEPSLLILILTYYKSESSLVEAQISSGKNVPRGIVLT